MAAVDERVGAEIMAVVRGLEEEQVRDLALADARAHTGDLFRQLEMAAARSRVNRSECVAAVLAEAKRLDLEELTEGAIQNRKRMAKIRRERPMETAKKVLVLSASRQRAIVALPPGRLEEFVHQGVPTVTGLQSLKKARAWEVVQAARTSRRLPPGEPIPAEPQRRKKEATLSLSQQFDLVMAMAFQLGSLTLEQAERLLLLVVSLFAIAPREAQRTTRRLLESTIKQGSEQDGTVAVDQVLRTLDALPQLWQEVEFGPGVDRHEMAGRACGMVSRLLLIISRWTRRSAAA